MLGEVTMTSSVPTLVAACFSNSERVTDANRLIELDETSFLHVHRQGSDYWLLRFAACQSRKSVQGRSVAYQFDVPHATTSDGVVRISLQT